MDRKESLKTMLLGSLSLPFLTKRESTGKNTASTFVANPQSGVRGVSFESPWKRMPDMTWTGAAYWANRLQDWQIRDGSLECVMRGKNRSVFCLTHVLENSRNTFTTRVKLQTAESLKKSEKNRVGIRLGAKGNFDDYRSAAIYGEGLNVGIDTRGYLFIGGLVQSDTRIASERLQEGIMLEIVAHPRGMRYALQVSARDTENNEVLSSLKYMTLEKDTLVGSVALFSDIRDFSKKNRNTYSSRFSNWILEGRKFEFNPDHTFGPIYFAQYTQHNGHLQLTAQLAPIPLPSKAYLEIKRDGTWKRIAETEVEYPSRTAQFKVSDWDNTVGAPYRVIVDLPLNDGTTHTYTWVGHIAAEPIEKEKVKALVMSCNFDYGFPDREVVDNAEQHNADLVLFVGDQFYEPTGGFGVQRAPVEKAYLDYLRKWYQFGWSYRELLRNRPSICLPDDHDVYQGNLFGSGGDKITDKPGGYDRDWGGYVMPADWVNLVMTTQASHLPDPYNPEPIKQGIHVYYTDWKYGGISFGIVEDRKFKSGPKEILPDSIEERDGFVTTPEYDISEHEFPDAQLLGERQLKFLRHWVQDWSRSTEFKALVSATTFHSMQTLPNGNASNGQQPTLPIPEPGTYVKGDEKVSDMDSNGWPQSKRNEALRILRKGYSIHLNGDQHLASITKYGIETFRDAGYQFTVPALNNSWPRRWWPPVSEDHQPVQGQPKYTGEFMDDFGNPMYIMAVANPRKTGLKPDHLYDRAPGYGVVTFNKETREVKMECWPRHVSPRLEMDGQYEGWPWTVEQMKGYQPSGDRYLPLLEIKTNGKPVLRVTHEASGELDHVLRVRDKEYRPPVASKGTYTVEIVDDSNDRKKRITGLKAEKNNKERIRIEL